MVCEKGERTTFEEKSEMFDGKEGGQEFSVKSFQDWPLVISEIKFKALNLINVDGYTTAILTGKVRIFWK